MTTNVVRFVKNIDDEAHVWLGQQIDPNEYYEIQASEWVSWATNSSFLAALNVTARMAYDDSGNSDITDLNEAINFLKGYDLTPKDSSGSPITRPKVTETGWHHEPRILDFYTSKYNSLYNRKPDAFTVAGCTDLGDAYLKFYDASGTQLIRGGEESAEDFQTRLDANCTVTIMDWQPTYDMEIVGALLFVMDVPAQDAYVWSIVAPDLPAQYGGSVPFAQGGWNLKFFTEKSVLHIDGRGAKRINYDPVYNTNKFRVLAAHPAGLKIGLQVSYNHFKA